MANPFDDVRLPEEIEQGARGGPQFQTSVIMLGTGYEQRNSDWSSQRCMYDVSYGIQTKADYSEVIKFFYARLGKGRGFRFKDWSDYQATGSNIGTGDGADTTFQLRKQYTSGSVTYNRKITRPITGTVNIYLNGVLQNSGVSINYSTGLVTFTSPPANGVAITADFEFDVPVRFDVDKLDIIMQWSDAAEIDAITLVELRE